MPQHRHHHHRRHDVYDDTHHNQQFDPSNEVTIHRHRGDSTRLNSHPGDHHPHHQSNAVVADPFHNTDSMWRAAERDMDRAFGGGLFGSMFGPMQNMMTSMDRMFDEVRANASPGSGGSYYYESRKMTVGPDGRVHEETVRTVPDEHGNPRTSRTVRDGDRVEEIAPSRGRVRGHRSSRMDDDVVIEEVDEHGQPVRDSRVARRSRGERDTRENRVARRSTRDERDTRENRVAERSIRDERDTHGRRLTHDRAHSTGNWLRDRYNQWRSRA